MIQAGTCPHPEKRSWPLQDEPEGLACSCGHAWAPYLFVGVANRFFHHEDKEAQAHRRLEVYRCRTRAGESLDHWHTTDRGKREQPQLDQLDSMVKDVLASTGDIHGRSRWSRRRKAKPMSKEERRRLRRWRRI